MTKAQHNNDNVLTTDNICFRQNGEQRSMQVRVTFHYLENAPSTVAYRAICFYNNVLVFMLQCDFNLLLQWFKRSTRSSTRIMTAPSRRMTSYAWYARWATIPLRKKFRVWSTDTTQRVSNVRHREWVTYVTESEYRTTQRVSNVRHREWVTYDTESE